MIKEHVEPMWMWPISTYRLRKTLILGIAALGLFELQRLKSQVSFRNTLSSIHQGPCDSLPIPAIQKPPEAVSQQWNRLQELFDAHQPNLGIERADFAGGQLAKATAELLANYLDMTAEEADHIRREHAVIVESLPVYPEGVFNGRGVVILAGGKYSEFAATTLGMLRLVGSRLPVEVWMIDVTEEKAGWCDHLARQGMACRFVSEHIKDMSQLSHHYQLKIAALLFSSFAEILYLDSDSMPVVNPDHIFDAPAYADTGAILWPDYWKPTESPYTPYITGRSDEKASTVPSFQTIDSGQMLWNKKKHWKSLCLSSYYNYFGPSYFYNLITQGGPGWGDKDTFPTALRALNVKWTMVPHPLQTQLWDDGTGHGTGSGMAMMQADPADMQESKPMFLHSNFIKFSARRQMCDQCVEDPSALTAEQRKNGSQITFPGSIMNRKSAIWEQLNSGKRIFATKTNGEQKYAMGILDTEKDIWRVMERVGCEGVFSDEGICRRIRRHLNKTFGGPPRWEGGSERMCS